MGSQFYHAATGKIHAREGGQSIALNPERDTRNEYISVLEDALMADFKPLSLRSGPRIRP